MKMFWVFTRQAFHNASAYRFELWLQVLSIFLMMYSVHWLWKVLYQQVPNAFGVNQGQMVTYGILAVALDSMFNPSRGPQTYISTQIRLGTIDTDLFKPMDFQLHMLARNAGEILFRCFFLILPMYIISFLFLDMELPNSSITGILFVISIVLGYLVLFSLSFLLGMLAMLTLNINSISWAYNALLRFFAGQMIPLWMFPNGIKFVADVLPFKSIYYIPLSIYVGRIEMPEIWEALLIQGFWVIMLMTFSRFIWFRVQARLIVQGG